MPSDIAVPHPYNPDPLFEGCQATHLAEPGVSFPSVEPNDGSVMFLGRTAIIEAAAVLFDISPDVAKQRLSNDPTPKQTELTQLKKQVEKLEAELSRYHALRDALADTGLLVTTFD